MQNQHIIGQLTVEIHGANTANAGDYQQACSQQVRSERFLSALNEELDRLAGDGVVLQIPRLEIELRMEREGDFERAFPEALRKALAHQVAHAHQQTMSVGKSVIALALHFLERGTLPWNASAQQKSAVQHLLTTADIGEAEAFLQEMEQRAAQQPSMWLRLICAVGLERVKYLLRSRYSFSSGLLEWLAELAAAPGDATMDGSASPQGLPGTPLAALRIWQLALQHRDLAARGEYIFQEKLKGLIPAQQPFFENKATRPERIDPAEWMSPVAVDVPFEEAVFIQNAGVVLLAPFFLVLFERTGLVENRRFVSEEAQHTAVHLLQYLVTGEQQVWEYDLSLHKLLCDVPEEMPIHRFTLLSDAQRTEADELLKEAIRQWAVLKSTSAAGLREMFLQREGKLTRDGRHGRLQVERKAVDVLMERLPWGFSVIKLPWMEGVLYVEW
ncbi:MAG: contractile injection system tape measure protein [Saprospiraceae bacterium]